jgi:hypothetical protein
MLELDVAAFSANLVPTVRLESRYNVTTLHVCIYTHHSPIFNPLLNRLNISHIRVVNLLAYLGIQPGSLKPPRWPYPRHQFATR